MKRFFSSLVGLMVLLCFAQVALAQTTTVSDAPPIPPLTGLSGLIIVLCMGASFALRNYVPSQMWTHTTWGAAIIAGASALIPALTTWAQAGTLTWNTLTPLVLGAAASLFTMSKPVGTDKKDAAKAEAKKPATPPAPPSA